MLFCGIRIAAYLFTCSSIGPELEKVRKQIAAAAGEAGAQAKQDEAYPGWNPDPSSKVLQASCCSWRILAKLDTKYCGHSCASSRGLKERSSPTDSSVGVH